MPLMTFPLQLLSRLMTSEATGFITKGLHIYLQDSEVQQCNNLPQADPVTALTNS